MKKQHNYLVMKGKQFLLSCMATIALMSTGYLGIKSFSQNKDVYCSLLIENIEALTDGDDLPEIIITCSAGVDGRCFTQGNQIAMCGEYMYYPCQYVGNPAFSCTNPPCGNKK